MELLSRPKLSSSISQKPVSPHWLFAFLALAFLLHGHLQLVRRHHLLHGQLRQTNVPAGD
jgi:hypothetical protein